jgi:hypothetical protein
MHVTPSLHGLSFPSTSNTEHQSRRRTVEGTKGGIYRYPLYPAGRKIKGSAGKQLAIRLLQKGAVRALQWLLNHILI